MTTIPEKSKNAPFYRKVEQMSREEFNDRVLRTIGTSHELSMVVSGDTESLSLPQRGYLVETLRSLGASIEDNTDLENTCGFIMKRIVS